MPLKDTRDGRDVEQFANSPLLTARPVSSGSSERRTEMALEDTRDGRDLLRLFSGGQESLDRLRAAMAAAGVTAESPDRLDDEGERLARLERQDP